MVFLQGLHNKTNRAEMFSKIAFQETFPRPLRFASIQKLSLDMLKYLRRASVLVFPRWRTPTLKPQTLKPQNPFSPENSEA